MTPSPLTQVVQPPPELSTSAFGESLIASLAAHPEGRIWGSDGLAVPHADTQAKALAIRANLASLPEGSVAILAQKTPATIAAVLGVLAAGRSYAPLDPAHPDERLLSILELLRPVALITDETLPPRLADWADRAGVRRLVLEDLTAPVATPPPLPPADAVAILHTSGSTGVPKQVRIGAEALASFNDWVGQEFALRPADCLLSHAPLAFDLSFLDIFAGLAAGASLALLDSVSARNGERALGLIAAAQVSVLQAAPSALALIVRAAAGRQFPQIRAVLFAGEPMPQAVLAGLAATFPEARLVNIYGCTETNDTFFYDVPREAPPDPLPLGRPLPGVRFEIISDEGTPVPPGDEGELWVACPTMMQGYSCPDLTERAFGIWQGQRFYRSGDRVRLGAEGLLLYLGRADSVQKINGTRVDLAEIEGWLARCEGVRELAVYICLRDGARHLECAVTTDGRSLTSLDLRRHAMIRLPPVAIPKSYAISPDPLPKNSNGKICRRMLAETARLR